MRRIKLFIVSLVTFLSSIMIVNAAPSSSISVSRSSIENGSSVTATVKVTGTAAWNIKITSSGSTSGCNASFADATANGGNTTKSFSVTCKATSTGKINFSYSGDITSSDGTNIKISGSRSVTVTAARVKSSNADLSSLSVSGYEISPGFNKNTLEYSLTVDSSVTSINVNATKSDSKAKVTNIGSNKISEGENKISIVVTAENGDQKTYIVKVTVKELNPITVIIDEEEYIVVKKIETLEKPLTYDESTVVIQDTEVPAFYSETTKFTLVGLKDKNGEISLYIYDEENDIYEKYEEIIFKSLIFYSIDGSEHKPDGYYECPVEIYGVDTVGYCKEGLEEFVLLYGMNVDNGNTGFYTYDKVENSLQRNIDEIEEIVLETGFKIETILIIIIFLLAGVIGYLVYVRKYSFVKKKK